MLPPLHNQITLPIGEQMKFWLFSRSSWSDMYGMAVMSEGWLVGIVSFMACCKGNKQILRYYNCLKKMFLFFELPFKGIKYLPCPIQNRDKIQFLGRWSAEQIFIFPVFIQQLKWMLILIIDQLEREKSHNYSFKDDCHDGVIFRWAYEQKHQFYQRSKPPY